MKDNSEKASSLRQAGKNGVKPLEETASHTGEMIKIVEDLDTHYSNMTLAEEKELGDIERRLSVLEEKVLSWDSNQSMLCSCHPEEASRYLQVVDEVRLFIGELESLNSSNESMEGNELLNCAHSILQIAMARLKEEFVHLLVHYQEPMESDHMSFRSAEDVSVDDFSNSSLDEESIDGKFQSDTSRGSEEFAIDLIHPVAVPDLRSIAKLMFLSSYDKECCQAYISVRKDALEECLSFLHVERFSIEELLKMDWKLLSCMIKRWNQAIKVFIRVYLVSERRLCDLIFADFPSSMRESCFVETSKASVMQLLSFGEAIAIGKPKVEMLFRILDMYEGLDDLLMDIGSLFPEGDGYSILNECHEVLQRLSESVRGAFVEFKYAIQSNTSNTPFAGGGVHPMTKYVMNYIKALADYSETIDLLLPDQDDGVHHFSSEIDGEKSAFLHSSPMACLVHSIIAILKVNLHSRSMLYKDDSLQNIFMMNNICYMVQKVKDSDLRNFLGDEWIKAHIRKFRQHAVSYERASWSLILSFLKEEGICAPGSSVPSKTVLKERFKIFNLAFEELYRIQTAWLVPDAGLRDDMTISISLKVLQAYRTFMGRYASHLDYVKNRDKYIKYSTDDLERNLLDLFGGSPKSLQYAPRK